MITFTNTISSLIKAELPIRSSGLLPQVTVKLLPVGEGETGFEEVFASGEWFAVQNLISIMSTAEFKLIIVRLYEEQYRMHYSNDD